MHYPLVLPLLDTPIILWVFGSGRAVLFHPLLAFSPHALETEQINVPFHLPALVFGSW